MKKLLFIVCFCLFFLVSAFPTHAASRIKGYVKKNGTYVAPHFKTEPNKQKLDNFSTKGNVNPFTGKKGTKKVLK